MWRWSLLPCNTIDSRKKIFGICLRQFTTSNGPFDPNDPRYQVRPKVSKTSGLPGTTRLPMKPYAGKLSSVETNSDIQFPYSVGGNTQYESRSMNESYTEIILPFTSNETLRDEYINVYGGLRFDKILEDLDALAGSIAYKHCDKMKEKLTIVTASVDRIDLIGKLQIDVDVRLSGKVTFVGKSSMQIVIRVEKRDSRGQWEYLAFANFTMVARDPVNGKAADIPPLRIENKQEMLLFQFGEENRYRKQWESETSLLKNPPTVSESLLLHSLFLESMGKKKNNNQNGGKEPWVKFMKDSVLTSTHFCQPQDRNIHNFIFGGYLMREAFDIAFANASLFIRGRPSFVALDDIAFKRPVPIGSILTFHSQVVYAAGAPHRSFQISVTANVSNVQTEEKETTNVFHFTFETSSPLLLVPKLIPTTYEEAIQYLEGKRRKEQGILQTNRHALFIHSEINH